MYHIDLKIEVPFISNGGYVVSSGVKACSNLTLTTCEGNVDLLERNLLYILHNDSLLSLQCRPMHVLFIAVSISR